MSEHEGERALRAEAIRACITQLAAAAVLFETDMKSETGASICDDAAALLRSIAAAMAEKDARIARLEAALRYWDEAFATGRNEPLYVARDNGRRLLEPPE